MGASHSVVGDQLVLVELVVEILLYLAVADLTSCRCINHTLRDIIDTSPDLQHQIDTALAGVVDDYRIKLSLPERRRALRLQQEVWDSCKPLFTKFCLPDSIQDSIFFKLHPDSRNCVGYCCSPLPEQSSDQPWSYLSHLPRRIDCEIIAFAVCLEENDLVALGVRHGNVPTPPSGYHALEVDLLCFSSGGGEHPSAGEPTLFIKNDDGTELDAMEMEIRGDLLAVLLKRRYQAENEFSIFNWKTAQTIVRLTSKVNKAIHAFRFLSDKVIVVANITHSRYGSLELYTLPEPQGDTKGTPITMVAALQLHNTHCCVYSMTFCSPPAKNGIPRNNHQFINAAVSTNPFTNSPDNIIYCCMRLEDSQMSVPVSLIVHSSTLLRYATSQDFKFIEWDDWRPMARCVVNWECHATAFSGQRWLREDDIWENQIWDFNQYRVKRLGKDFSVETETARISVITKASSIETIMDNVPFDSGTLPYVRIV